jgi:hypothetical protein
MPTDPHPPEVSVPRRALVSFLQAADVGQFTQVRYTRFQCPEGH